MKLEFDDEEIDIICIALERNAQEQIQALGTTCIETAKNGTVILEDLDVFLSDLTDAQKDMEKLYSIIEKLINAQEAE